MSRMIQVTHLNRQRGSVSRGSSPISSQTSTPTAQAKVQLSGNFIGQPAYSTSEAVVTQIQTQRRVPHEVIRAWPVPSTARLTPTTAPASAKTPPCTRRHVSTIGATLPEHCFHRDEKTSAYPARSFTGQGKEESSTPSTICREEEVCSVTTPSSVAELTPPGLITKSFSSQGPLIFAERVKEASPNIPMGVRSATVSLREVSPTSAFAKVEHRPLEGVRSAEASRRLFQSPQVPQGLRQAPNFFPESVRGEYERKLLRLALRRYREDLQAQIHSAEEVIQDLSPAPRCTAQASTSPTSSLRSVHSMSPEALAKWPTTPAQQRPSWHSNSRHSFTQGIIPPENFAPSPDAERLQARQALEVALQEAQAPPAPQAPQVPQRDPRRTEEKQDRRSLQAPTSRGRFGRSDRREALGASRASSPVVMSRNTSRAPSRAPSQAPSRAPSCGPSGAATPEVPPPPPVSPLERLRGALACAKRSGVDDVLLAKADAFLRLQESRKQALQLTISKMGSAFERARLCNDVPCMKQIKEQLISLQGHGPEVDRLRRRVHNAIEDLKGHLRVFCRVRPLSDKEHEMDEEVVVRMVDNMKIELPRNGVFTFDGVFAAGRQEEVFEECRDLVQSTVDGHNVTIFAYGQTGAGKTYTLYGTPQEEGIAGRAISEVFEIIQRFQQSSTQRSFVVSASMFELYRNRLVDLLRRPEKRAKSPPCSPPCSPKLNLRSCESGMQVDNLSEEEVQDAMQLKRLLYRGLAARSTSPNALNAESSRSHLMFTIKVTSTDGQNQLSGKLVLCDLGGSERLKKSEATGEQLKEAIEINRSLTALGDVIEAVAERKRQVPYRNHKLTQLLQDSLGGTSKTLMFVNCSPARCNLHETAMSLNYALRAKRVVNAVPSRKVWASR